MQILQDLLVRKKNQEEIRRELQQRQVLHENKDIFLEAFDMENLDENSPIIAQLVHIVEKINKDDVDENKKLMEWSSRNVEKKFIEKVSTKIAIG